MSTRAVVEISPPTTMMPVVRKISQATRPVGSSARTASRTESEIWSAILSGWPSVTDSEVNRKLSLISRTPFGQRIGKTSWPIFPALRVNVKLRAAGRVDLELRIRRANGLLLDAELAADDVRALHDRGRLVERDQPVRALPAEAAVRGQDEVLRVDVGERVADVVRDLLRRLDLKRPVADDADGDLLLEAVPVGAEELEVGEAAVLHLDRPDVAVYALEVDLDHAGVRGLLEDALHVRVAPAGMDPD